MKRLLACLFIIAFTMLTDSSFAQTIIYPNTNTRQNFSLEMSVNPAFFIEGGYHYRMDNLIAGKSILIQGVIGAPIFLLKEFDSFRFALGGSVKLIEHGRFGLVTGLFTSLATSENVNGNFISWNLKLNFLPGLYSGNWFAALDLAWNPTIATHITHSDYVKSVFEERYPDDVAADEMLNGPGDGWYSTPANRLMAGLIAGYTISGACTIYLNGGINYTPNDFGIFMFGDIGVIPFYLKMGLVYHR